MNSTSGNLITASTFGPWKSSEVIPILVPWISIPVNPISPPILGPWISNPIPGISVFGFLISIPASIVCPWISREETPNLGLWISIPANPNSPPILGLCISTPGNPIPATIFGPWISILGNSISPSIFCYWRCLGNLTTI